MFTSNQKSQASITSSIRGPAGTSAAIRRGKLEISDPIPVPRRDLDMADSRTDDGRDGHHRSTSLAVADTWPRRGTAPALYPFNRREGELGPGFDTSYYNESKRSSTALMNTHQSMSSLAPSVSKRKGGLRATFRRVFGSKRQKNTFSTTINDQRSVRSSGNLIGNADFSHHPLKKPSLLFEELIRGRALNSHAPTRGSPEPGAGCNSSKSDLTRPAVDGYARRNSLPSVVLSAEEAQSLALKLNQQGVGPGSTAFPRSLRRMPHKSLINSMKRRSRSADALRDMSQSQTSLQAQERRLSDEIKYWRNSILDDPIPVYSPTRAKGWEEKKERESTRSASSPTPTAPSRRPSEAAPAKPQVFDFTGLAIGDGDASVEQRITTVEVKLVDLECAIANLQGYDVPQPVVLAKPPRRRQALPKVSQSAHAPASGGPNIYPKSSFDSYSTNSTSSSSSSSYSQCQLEQISDNRQSAADTVRPVTATRFDSPSAQTPRPVSQQKPPEDQLARLVSMLNQEQEARRGLESQLKDLQRQINDINFPVALRGPPTPSLFRSPRSNQVVDASPFSTKRATILPFRTVSPMPTKRKTSSPRENEGDETDTDDGFQDVYETPTEVLHDYGFGVHAATSPPLVGVL